MMKLLLNDVVMHSGDGTVSVPLWVWRTTVWWMWRKSLWESRPAVSLWVNTLSFSLSVTELQLVFIQTHHISFSACDCNMEGTERPSCDPETGECICRIGVTGIFCDECAPGYDSAFPACRECHPCNAFWAEDVTDVQRAAQMMRTFIPLLGDNLQPGDSGHLQRMLEMHSQLDDLSNLTGLSPPKVEKVEKLFAMMRLVPQLLASRRNRFKHWQCHRRDEKCFQTVKTSLRDN